MKLNFLLLLAVFFFVQNGTVSAEIRCPPLTKGELHSLLTNPDKSIRAGNYKLHLIDTCDTSCGEDCDVLLHGNYQETDKVEPFTKRPDSKGNCTYNIGPNDHIHVEIKELKR